jgi:hypothetical protein
VDIEVNAKADHSHVHVILMLYINVPHSGDDCHMVNITFTPFHTVFINKFHFAVEAVAWQR